MATDIDYGAVEVLGRLPSYDAVKSTSTGQGHLDSSTSSTREIKGARWMDLQPRPLVLLFQRPGFPFTSWGCRGLTYNGLHRAYPW